MCIIMCFNSSSIVSYALRLPARMRLVLPECRIKYNVLPMTLQQIDLP